MITNRSRVLSVAASFTLAIVTVPVIGLCQTTSVAAAAPDDAVAPSSPAPTATQASNARPGDAKVVESHKVDGDTIVCRDVQVTGSRLRTRKTCTSATSEKAASEWAAEQQAKGGIAASAGVNTGG